MGWMAGIRLPAGARDFSLLHSIQTSSAAQPASYATVHRALSLEVKRAGCEDDHSPPASAEVKNDRAMPPLSHMSSWCGA
jgi:hypothetical protein